MAIQEVNAIAEALRSAMGVMEQRRQFGQEYSLRQQNLQSEMEARKAEAQYRKDELVQRKEQFDLQQKASQKIFEAQQAQTEYANAQGFQRSGITPPGSQVIPGMQAPQFQAPVQQAQVMNQIPAGAPANIQQAIWGGNISQPPTGIPQAQAPLVLSDLQNAQLISKGGGTYEVPPLWQSPEQQLIRQQAQEAEARKIREQQALQAAEGRRLLMTMAQEHLYRKDEIAQTQAGHEKIREMESASALEIAKLKTGTDFSEFAQQPGAADMLTRLKIGTLSQEDVNKSIYKKQISGWALDQGYQILPKAKTDQITALETMGNLLPVIRRMINARHLHPVEVNNPLSEVGQQYNADAATIRAAAPQASVALSGVRRFTQQELARFDSLFIPGSFPLVSGTPANLSKYNEFKGNLSQAMEQVTKGLGTEQTNGIISNLRSKGLSYMQIQQPDEEQQQGLKIYKPNPKTGILELVPAGIK